MNTLVLSTEDMADAISQGLIKTNKDTPRIFSLQTQVSARFQEASLKMLNKRAGVYSDSAYDGLMIFAKAVQNSDGSSEQIRNYLRHDLVYEGFSGRFIFDDNGDTEKTHYLVEDLSYRHPPQ